MRETGYYWVRQYSTDKNFQPAFYTEVIDNFLLLGKNTPYKESELFSVGSKIEKP